MCLLPVECVPAAYLTPNNFLYLGYRSALDPGTSVSAKLLAIVSSLACFVGSACAVPLPSPLSLRLQCAVGNNETPVLSLPLNRGQWR